jgi:hypothetical protein
MRATSGGALSCLTCSNAKQPLHSRHSYVCANTRTHARARARTHTHTHTHTHTQLSLVTQSTSQHPFRYARDGTEAFTLTDASGVVVSDEDTVVRLVNGDPNAPSPTALSIQDDYKWWRDHDYVPSSGKPLWITEDDHRCVQSILSSTLKRTITLH